MNRMLNLRTCAAALAAGLVLAACSGGGGDDTPPPTAPNLGTGGGTVATADDRARLVVPAGALTAPATVTLTAVANPVLPPDPDLLPETVVDLGGDGGALAVPAQISLTAAQAFPQTAAAAQRLRAQLIYRNPDQEACDTDGDGDIDNADLYALALGGSCYQPPQLVRLTPEAASLIGICNPPVGLTAGCRLDSLAAARLALRFDPTAPTVTVDSFDGPQSPSRLVVPKTYTLRVNATDNKGVVRVRFDKITKVGFNFVVQTLGEDTAAPYEVAVPLAAADNGDVRIVARAYDAWGNTGAAGVQLTVQIDSSAPTAAIVASATTVPVGQGVSFDVTASDNSAVMRVELLRNGSVVATDTLPPYTFQTAPFTSADLGAQVFQARAVDLSDNVGVSSSVTVQVVPAPDTTPPSATLQASATAVTVGQTVTFTATASDDTAVARVEFLRNGSKVAEDTSAPYTHTPPVFAGGDIGSTQWVARAVDSAGNTGDSAAVTVTVAGLPGTEFWVNPATGLDTNPGTNAAPVRTLAKAFTLAGAGGTVWLQNGNYTAAAEGLAGVEVPTGRTLPAGATLRAVNDGGATLGFTIQAPAGGSLVGLNFDTSSYGRVLATGGTLTLSRPQWVQLGLTTLGQGLQVSGSAKVTIDPKGNAAHNYTSGGLTGFVLVEGSAELVVDGGVLDGTTGQAGAFMLDGTAKLTLLNFTLANTSGAWVGGNGVLWPLGLANQVWVENSTIDLANAQGVCLLQDRALLTNTVVTTTITLKNVALKRCGGATIQLREGAPVLTLENVVLEGGGRFGIEAGQIGFDSGFQYAKPTVTVTGGSISGMGQGGVLFNSGGSLSMNGTTVDGGAFSALQLNGVKTYQLTLRNSTVKGTGAGVVLQGDGTSAFDLGTAAAPGGNTLQAATAVRVSTAAGVLATAVGNTWKPNVQGANAAGAYTAASSVCNGANPCDVTAGTGGNFTFQGAGAGAALRLAGP